jgi:hypothetical protein
LRRLADTRVVALLVDEPSLQERPKGMVVSLAYRGRAIPLAWWGYRPTAWLTGQVALIATLLHWGAAGIPPGCRGLVQADGGWGTSPALLQAIAAQAVRRAVAVADELARRHCTDAR